MESLTDMMHAGPRIAEDDPTTKIEQDNPIGRPLRNNMKNFVGRKLHNMYVPRTLCGWASTCSW